MAAGAQLHAVLYCTPAVVVSRDGGGESRQVYFGAGMMNLLTHGMTATLFRYEDRYEDR